MKHYEIELLKERYCVLRYQAGFEQPGKAFGRLFSFTMSDEESSLLCDEALLLMQEEAWQSEKIERGFLAIRVCVVLDFSITGLLYRLCKAFAEAEISIFALSTFNTDYVLFKEENLKRAIACLEKAGFCLSKEG